MATNLNTEARLTATEQRVDDTNNKVKDLNGIMIGMVFVSFLAMISLIISGLGLYNTYLHDNTATYREYRDQLEAQNDKTKAINDSLSKTLKEIQESKTAAQK